MTTQQAGRKIIDTHIHIWDLEKIHYAWLDGDTSILNRSYRFDELLPSFQKMQITGGVLVQAANNLEDTRWMLETARQYKEIKGVVGWLPLTDPDAVQTLLETDFLNQEYFKGVRHLVHNEADTNWLLQDPVLESLQLLASFNIPYDMVGINDGHLKTAIQVTQKIPQLKIVLDHLNQPPIFSQQRFGAWGSLMKEIAQSPNVYAKISGMGTASGKSGSWSEDDIAPYVEYALDTFNSTRCFCGGDWPVSKLAGTYEHLWQIYIAILEKRLPGKDCENVLHNNAGSFYRLSD